METSSTRPYLAIFAIVALVVAGFIIKAEYSSNNQTDDQVAAKSPRRMLVAVPGAQDRVPEKIPDWFKRVGYKDLGFENQQDMEATEAIMDVKRGDNYTPDQLKLIHKLLATPGIPSELGVSLLPGMRPNAARAEFTAEVKKLYGTNKGAFHAILATWCRSGDEDLVKTYAKDSDKDLAAYAQQIITDYEFPSGKDL